jgi:putative transposase
VPIEVGVEPPKSNGRGYVKSNYRDKKGGIVNPKLSSREIPIGDKQAFINMGLNNLFATVITDGSALLVKGGSIKSEYYWWKREIATYQAIRDLLRNAEFSTWKEYHEKYLKAVYKRDERLRNRNIYIAAIRFLADKLYNKGIGSHV